MFRIVASIDGQCGPTGLYRINAMLSGFCPAGFSLSSVETISSRAQARATCSSPVISFEPSTQTNREKIMSLAELDAYRTFIGVILIAAVRCVSNRLGPNMGAILLGLPLTSPLYLLGVSPTQTSSMLMLCSAVAAYPGIHAWKFIAARCRFVSVSLLGGTTSFISANLLLQLASRHNLWTFLICCLACMYTGILKFGEEPIAANSFRSEVPLARRRSPILGYGIPIACWIFVMCVKNWVPCGELIGGFPLITASVVAGEWFSQGRRAALRIADSFPYGQSSTVAFLTVFSLTVAILNPSMATALAYVAAAVVTSTVANLQRDPIKTPDRSNREANSLFNHLPQTTSNY